MDIQKIRDWEKSVDQAEQTPLTADLPKDAPLGAKFQQPIEDGGFRIWIRVKLIAGNVGARWAYWRNASTFEAIADNIFNGDAAHFIGMLGIPFTGKIPGVDTEAWVLVSPRIVAPPEERTYEEKSRERYERSHEVYDVNTQTSHKI